MSYSKEMKFRELEFDLNLRTNIPRTKEFKEQFPNFSGDFIDYSKKEQEKLDLFKQENEKLFDKLMVEIEVDFALISLDRRCHIEVYKRLQLPFAKDYWEKEDLISVCSDKDLIALLDLIKRIRLK